MKIERPAEINIEDCRQILVAKMDNIGDFVLATPFLRGLRAKAKNAIIDLVVSPNSYGLAKLCPYVDTVTHAQLHFKDNCIDQINFGSDSYFSDTFSQRYSEKKYNLALVPRWDWDYSGAAFVAKNSGAQFVVGFSVPALYTHIPDYSKLYTHVIRRPFAAHDVEHNDALLQYVGGTSDTGAVDVWVEDLDQKFAEKAILALHLDRQKPIISVCPGASGPNRLLPANKLASILCRVKQIIPDAQFIVLGGLQEKEVGEELSASINDCRNFCGATTLTQVAALLSLSTMAVSMDSGPAHIAAGVDVPVVVFSPHPKDGDPIDNHSPVRFHPWGKTNAIVLQPEHAVWPCKDRCRGAGPNCIIAILDEDAVQAITGILQNGTKSQTLV